MATDTTTTAFGLSPTELRAWRGLLRVHTTLVKALDGELLAAHDLGVTSYEVLMFLADAPDQRMRMCDLAASIVLSRSGLTRLADRLERDGLIERTSCPSDARGSFAVLTAAGRERLEAARDTHLAGVRRHFVEHLDDSELEALGGLWAKILPGAAAGCASACD